jgi:hypothetical protein
MFCGFEEPCREDRKKCLYWLVEYTVDAPIFLWSVLAAPVAEANGSA